MQKMGAEDASPPSPGDYDEDNINSLHAGLMQDVDERGVTGVAGTVTELPPTLRAIIAGLKALPAR
jgi:hypothetical protein